MGDSVESDLEKSRDETKEILLLVKNLAELRHDRVRGILYKVFGTYE